MRQKCRKLLSVLLALVLALALAAPAFAYSSDVAAIGDKKYTNFNEAVSEWGDGETLTLLADVTRDSTITVSGTRTLDLHGHGIKMTGDGSVIKVNSDAYLVLKDTEPAVEHKFAVNDGLAAVDEENGTLPIKGGYITGGAAKNGGGLYIESSAKVTMDGGTIIGNKATGENNGGQGGAGVFVMGTFTMKNGAVSYNKSNHLGGGVRVDSSGSFTMSGADCAVSNNSARYGAGVYVSGGTFTMSKGSISQNNASESAGGLHVKGPVTVSGGYITGNEAKNNGGGVAIENGGAFVVNGSPTISGNTATNGGGVYFYASGNKFELSGEPTFNGGVYLPENKRITITDALSNKDKNPIEVTMAAPGVFTTGWNDKMKDADVNAFFASGNTGYGVTLTYNDDENPLEATLAENVYTVTLDVDPTAGTAAVTAGKWTVLDGKGTKTVPGGTVVTLTAKADDGSHFVEWQLDGTKTDWAAEGQEYTVNADVKFTAVFEKDKTDDDGDDDDGDNDGGAVYYDWTPTYTPVIVDSEHGKVTVSPGAAAAGRKVTVTAAPDEGFELESLTVRTADGKDVALTANADGTYTYTQPGSRVTITAAFKAAEKPFVNPFVDVHEDDYFNEAVLWAAEGGITDGTDATHFSPDARCSRGETVTFLWCAEGCPEPTLTACPFEDVAEDAYYYKAVLWAVENGITNGTDATHFSPGLSTTREQFATFLYRCAQLHGKGFTGLWSFRLDFPDAGEVSDWAYEAMCWMVMSGVVNGMDGALNPQGDALRAHVVCMLCRFASMA